eukprot:TRINITY_DN4309_c0_g1_i1.p1 TRINITY_DN4309_c0_g1~~TRINITY_DN4309_c0_g1_i1.p1  ORF type:complete len:530 (-),score=131.66 TRINITY_DN4309_c0_g1_i1:94-1683(-)
MNQAYYRPPQSTTVPEPTIIALPTSGGPLSLTSSVFANQRSLHKLQPNSDIEKEACLRVFLGKAIDGLPLALNIHRSYSVQSPILSTLGVSRLEDLPEALREPIITLEKAVQIKSCETGIKTDQATQVKYYRTYNDVGSLFTNTVLAKLLDDNTVSVLNERGEGYEEHLRDKSTTMHLAVPISSDTRSVLDNMKRTVGLKRNPESTGQALAVKTFNNQATLDKLYLETIGSYLPNVKFRAYKDNRLNSSERSSYGSYGSYNASPIGIEAYEGLLSDRASYLQALSLASSVELLIPIQDLITNVLLPLSRSLQDTMHANGRVHADIKPSNILLLESGPILIDANGCSSGSVSGIYTPKWGPPEQILGKSVVPSSDVFSLGMILLSFLKGEAWGELKMFKMPGTSERIEVLDMEGIWLDPKIWKDAKIRDLWTEKMKRFLNFRQENRPENAGKFAGELEELIQAGNLPELKPLLLKLPLQSARLNRFDDKDTAVLKDVAPNVSRDCSPVWVMEDCYPNLNSSKSDADMASQ